MPQPFAQKDVMHHRELGKKTDAKGIMIRADHMIQSRHPLSPHLSLSVFLSLFPAAMQSADSVVHYAMCESFWSRTVTVFGGAQLADIC